MRVSTYYVVTAIRPYNLCGQMLTVVEIRGAFPTVEAARKACPQSGNVIVSSDKIDAYYEENNLIEL